MATDKRRARRTKTLVARRSPKAGRPPRETPPTPRVRRRGRASAAVRKDGMLMQAADGPRVLWGVAKPKVKKR